MSTDERLCVCVCASTKWNHAHAKHAKIQIGPKRVVSFLNYFSCSQQFIKSEIQEKKKQEGKSINQHQRLMVSAGVCVLDHYSVKCFFFHLVFASSCFNSCLCFVVINLKIQFFNFGPIQHQTVASMYVGRTQYIHHSRTIFHLSGFFVLGSRFSSISGWLSTFRSHFCVCTQFINIVF